MNSDNFFSREYAIKSYECDCNGVLRIVTLMNIFQDVADSHASKMGVGIEHCLNHGLAWVGSNYHIKISRMPTWHERIVVKTWPSGKNKLIATRDFLVEDEKGNAIIVASSQWVLIDFAKKRPVPLENNLPEYQLTEKRSLDTDFPKYNAPENADITASFKVRYDDIDVNKHVNNSIYPVWATECIDSDFRMAHQPQEIEISFKKECHHGESVEVKTQFDGKTTLHSIVVPADNREVARLRILWK